MLKSPTNNASTFIQILHSHPLPFLLVDTETGIILDANKSASKFYGYNLYELYGLEITAINMLSFEVCVDRCLHKTNEQINSFVCKHRLKNGELRTVEIHRSIAGIEGKKLCLAIIYDITAIEKNKLFFKNEQRYLAESIAGANIATWQWNICTGDIFINEQWATILGYSLQELEPASIATWRNNTHPDDLMLSEALLQKHFDGELEYYEAEIRMKHKSGQWVWVLDRGKIHTWDVNGRPLFMSGIHQDISQKKQQELELRQIKEHLLASENNFRSFFNNTDCFLFVLDNQGRILRVNRAVLQQLGYQEYELIGRDVLLLYPENRRAEASEIVTQMLLGTASNCPVPLLCKDGSLIPVETKVTSSLWNGSPAIFGISKNISEIKESEEKFSNAFLSNPAMMAITTLEDGTFIDVNQTFLNTLGYTRDEVVSKSFLELKLFTAPAKRKKILKTLQQNGRAAVYSLKIKGKSGKLFHVMFCAETIRLQKCDLLLSVMVDVTPHIRAKQELVRAKNEAYMANRAKSEFLANMSHEIRTPINGVIGMTQILRFTSLTSEQQDYLDGIDISSNNLLSLINDILDLSKIESGKIEIESNNFSLSDTIHDVITINISNIHQKNLKLKQHIPTNIPVLVKGDTLRLKQILNNLLSNAVKFTQKGIIEVRLTLLEHDSKKVIVRITVSDTGIGIHEENLQKIFLPFKQAEKGTTRLYGGTGLGLAICKNLAELMGGTISVSSKIGVGSSFSVELPFAVASDIEPLQNYDIYNELTVRPGRRLSVLHADDNYINQHTTALLLSKMGHEVISAQNGKEALKIWRNQKLDFVLLDIRMPVMDGIETLAAIREDERNKGLKRTPVIALTADVMKWTEEQLLKLGFDGYLSKPMEISKFISKINQVMQLDQ